MDLYIQLENNPPNKVQVLLVFDHFFFFAFFIKKKKRKEVKRQKTGHVEAVMYKKILRKLIMHVDT